MKRNLLLFFPLVLLLMGCDINLGNTKDIDVSTLQGRQENCIKGIKDKIKSNNYEVIWDNENDNFDKFILQGLLKVDNGYFDIECLHSKNGTGFEVNIFEIEEITY